MALKFLRFDAESLMNRFLLLADGDGGGGDGGSSGGGGQGGDGGATGGEAKGGEAKGADGAGGENKGGEGGDGKGGDAGKWREQFSNPEVRKFAETSTDPNHFGERVLEMRKKLSGAIFKPGKDAKPEDVAAYRKAMGVPETAEGYVFKDEEGYKPTEVDLAMRGKFAKAFHEHNVPAPVAEALAQTFKEMVLETAQATKDADASYAKETDEALRKEWGADYETNKKFAGRATQLLFGTDFESARQITDKTDRYILDNPLMLKAFAKIGREMGEGRLGSMLNDDEKGDIDKQLADLRERQEKAKSEGNSRLANELYQQEQDLIAKRNGKGNIVGANNRAA